MSSRQKICFSPSAPKKKKHTTYKRETQERVPYVNLNIIFKIFTIRFPNSVPRLIYLFPLYCHLQIIDSMSEQIETEAKKRKFIFLYNCILIQLNLNF